MAQPVWVLSVDLQTKTATFQSGMAEAAKSARGAFTEIKGGAAEMGGETGRSMMEARHGVMLLSEEFGIHLPRSLTMFIASIGPVGAAMEAAFPFLAIAVGATMLIEKLVQMHEAGEKLTLDQMKFATAVQNAFNQLDEKILQAQIRADELRNDHLAALHHQLQLIDRQGMDELVHSFQEVARAADGLFGDLKSNWYALGHGSAGAKHALDEFQAKYEILLAKGRDKEASDLLRGTRESAEKSLAALKETSAHLSTPLPAAGVGPEAGALNLISAAQAAKVKAVREELDAQQALVDALNAQVTLEGKVAQLKQLDTNNAKTQTGNELGAQRAAAAKQAADAQLRMGEQAIAGERAASAAQLDIHRASIAERLQTELDFAGRERDVQDAANAAQIAALDRAGKDYQNQLAALNQKSLEIQQEYETKVTELKSRAAEEQAAKDLRDLQASEREKIGATEQGSAARLAAINAAIREEEALNLQDTQNYRDLLTQRIQATHELFDEQSKLQAEAGKEDADHAARMGELTLSAQAEALALANSMRRISDAERVRDAQAAANAEYAVKAAALQRELLALDTNGKEYENKLKALQDKEIELAKEHENQLTQIKTQAEIARNQRILSAEQTADNAIAQGLTQSIMRHQTWAQMMASLTNQVISGMLETAIKSALADDFTKEKDAAAAARKAFLAGMQLPFPANIIAAPALAAGAFAAVMAFEGGGIVPGVGTGDSVPAMLTPGEGVVPKGVMEGLSSVARNGGFDRGPGLAVHVRPVYHVQAIDGDGMQAALEKHNAQLERHVDRAIRKLNR